MYHSHAFGILWSMRKWKKLATTKPSEDEIKFDEVHAPTYRKESTRHVFPKFGEKIQNISGTVATAKYSRVYSINSYMCLLIHTCIHLDMLHPQWMEPSTYAWGYNNH